MGGVAFPWGWGYADVCSCGELIDLGMSADLVARSGSWYSYGDTRIGQGRENAREYFLNNPEAFTELDRKIREANGLTATSPVAAEASAAPPKEAAAEPKRRSRRSS